MTEEKLIRKLNSVGKHIFVDYFAIFKSLSEEEITTTKCIEHLVLSKVSNDSGAAIRCSNAKLIFNSGMEYSALSLIVKSNKLSDEVLKKAKILIAHE